MKNVKPHRQYLLILLRVFNLLIFIITVTSCTNARKSTNVNNDSLFLIMSHDEETDEQLKKNHLESRIVFKHNSLDSFKFDSINVTLIDRYKLTKEDDIVYVIINGQNVYYGPFKKNIRTIIFKDNFSPEYCVVYLVGKENNNYLLTYWGERLTNDKKIGKAKNIQLTLGNNVRKGQEMYSLYTTLKDTINFPYINDTFSNINIPIDIRLANFDTSEVQSFTMRSEIDFFEGYQNSTKYIDKPLQKLKNYHVNSNGVHITTIGIPYMLLKANKNIYLSSINIENYAISNMRTQLRYDKTLKVYKYELKSYEINGKKQDTNAIVIDKLMRY